MNELMDALGRILAVLWILVMAWQALALAVQGVRSLRSRRRRKRAIARVGKVMRAEIERLNEATTGPGGSYGAGFALNQDLEHHFSGVDPSEIPDEARSVKWEACHLFSPYAKPPKREPWGLVCEEPPLAMTCPECDLKQPVLRGGGRVCRYCGVRMQLHGSRVYFWFVEDVQ